MSRPCNVCDGEGLDSCPVCMGTGEVSVCMVCGASLDAIEAEHRLCEDCCLMDSYDDEDEESEDD